MEVYEERFILYLVIEYCPSYWITYLDGDYSEPRLSDIFKKLLLALKHIHSKGLIHGNICPDSIRSIDDEYKFFDLD